MRSILVVNFFHSSEERVGSLRTQGFVRYLPQFGWKPRVITKFSFNNKQGRVYKTANSSAFYAPSIPINKPLHLEVFTWIPFMLAKAVGLLRRDPISILLISCPPFHPALVGVLLKRWFDLRLVVDYRDAWGLNPYYETMSRFHRWILKRDRPLERFLLRHADLLVVSHQTMKEKHIRCFPFLSNRVEVVYNGFDQDEIGGEHEPLFPRFTILHLGDFYAKRKTRDPTLFLSALQKFISRGKIPPEKLEVLFLGERYEQIERAISNFGLSPYVSCRERVSHPEAMRYLRKSHLLLLIEQMDVMTTKIFEYLATGKPILALIKEGEIKDFLEKYSENSYVLTNPDVHETMMAVTECFENYKSHQANPNRSFLSNFDRRNQTRRLAMFLDKISGESS
ncbi:MAG: glycosyltransferase [Thermodesulfobacteriota bacterium]